MKRVLLGCVAVLGLNACAVTAPPVLNLTNLDKVDFSVARKTGESCQTVILNVFPTGQMTIAEAVESAQIRRIDYIEYTHTSYVVVTKSCLLVHGN